jgi:hypothetical protein
MRDRVTSFMGSFTNVRNTLVGFTQDEGFRVFWFDRLGIDGVRIRCTVSADLALIRTYGIQIQELPLLCRDLLDRWEEGREIQPLIFAESDMRDYANERAAVRKEAARKKKPWRRRHGDHVGVLPGGPAAITLPGRY